MMDRAFIACGLTESYELHLKYGMAINRLIRMFSIQSFRLNSRERYTHMRAQSVSVQL